MFKILDKFKRKQLEKAHEKKEEKKARVETKMVHAEKVTAKKAKKATRDMRAEAWKQVLAPLTTEKTNMQMGMNQYSFRVAQDANKIEVARAIEELYGVTVERVRMLRKKGKSVVFGRTRGKQSDTKKAIVTIGKGEKIEAYE